jgi:hypothetical protein
MTAAVKVGFKRLVTNQMHESAELALPLLSIYPLGPGEHGPQVQADQRRGQGDRK